MCVPVRSKYKIVEFIRRTLSVIATVAIVGLGIFAIIASILKGEGKHDKKRKA
jgi:hypothetical protein